jgi:hypothetical protein
LPPPLRICSSAGRGCLFLGSKEWFPDYQPDLQASAFS